MDNGKDQRKESPAPSSSISRGHIQGGPFGNSDWQKGSNTRFSNRLEMNGKDPFQALFDKSKQQHKEEEQNAVSYKT